MQLLIISLCVVATVLIVLEATPCSMDKKREMLIKACGHYRRKRGFAESEKAPHKPRNSANRNSLQFDEIRHHNHLTHLTIVANDTSGGLLIRHKREDFEVFMYCCLDLGNCTGHFSC